MSASEIRFYLEIAVLGLAVLSLIFMICRHCLKGGSYYQGFKDGFSNNGEIKTCFLYKNENYTKGFAEGLRLRKLHKPDSQQQGIDVITQEEPNK